MHPGRRRWRRRRWRYEGAGDRDQEGAEGEDLEEQGEDLVLRGRAGLDFKCKLDKGGFKSCDSPFKDKVDVGKHKFKVFAIDKAGNADPSPAKTKFKRVEALPPQLPAARAPTTSSVTSIGTRRRPRPPEEPANSSDQALRGDDDVAPATPKNRPAMAAECVVSGAVAGSGRPRVVERAVNLQDQTGLGPVQVDLV